MLLICSGLLQICGLMLDRTPELKGLVLVPYGPGPFQVPYPVQHLSIPLIPQDVTPSPAHMLRTALHAICCEILISTTATMSKSDHPGLDLMTRADLV